MRIVNKDPSADQNLLEYMVGESSGNCTYPGIAQCFAIAGWLQRGMLCAHISPGATKEEMAATFAAFKNAGGENVMSWYVVGPFTEHFAVTKAQWRSLKDIKKTFRKPSVINKQCI